MNKIPSKEIISKKFGRLTAVSEASKASNGTMRYLCQCDCGKEATVRKGRLLSGETTSCGCKQIIEITGKRFGLLTVISQQGNDNFNQSIWLCKCDCGNDAVIRSYSLRKGKTDSCGCLRKKRISKKLTTHGKCGTKIYNTWFGMKTRCNDLDDSRYGGRGIKYQESWESFESFYKDMGDPPSSKYEIDRIDNNKGYSKENCRWTTKQVNTSNTRRSRTWTIDEITYQLMSEAVEKTGLSRWQIQDRCHKKLKGYSTSLKYKS